MARDIKYYHDIVKLGKDFTGKKDLSVIFNEQALRESVMNIISTEPGEHIYRPDFGCALNRFVFEPIDEVTSLLLQKTIIDTLLKYESRIDQLEVDVIPDEDNNTYEIYIVFSMKTSNIKQTINISLDKIR